jgi:hypothetical protein
MVKITVGFSRPRNMTLPVFSWAIRAFEGTKYSHVFLRWESKSGPEVVYEASGSRVRFMNGKYFDEIAETIDTFDFLISSDDYRRLIRFVMTNVGVRYGVKQVLGIALKRIFGLKKNPFADGKESQVCSETVAYFLKDVLGYKLGFDPDTAGPREIYDFLSKIRCERGNRG